MNPTLLLSLAQVMTGVLKANPEVPKSISQIATDAESSIAAILVAIQGGAGGFSLNPGTILAAIGGVVAALQSDPNLPQGVLAKVQSLNKALAAALEADKVARQKVDPSILKPIERIP
jgi:hypothetical protein